MVRSLFICLFFFVFMPHTQADELISTNDTMKLNDWTFYEGELLIEDDATKSSEQVTVPHQWGNLFGDKNGYGTYVTTLQFNELLIGHEYALHIPYASTAYALYFNGVKQAEVGKVAANEAQYKPEQRVLTHYFTITDANITIALQVANFSNNVGGATRSITLGPRDVVNQQYQIYTNKEYFILGGFLFMVLNVFSLYYYRRQEYSYLVVGLLGSFLIVWYIFSKDHLIMDVFPNMSWELMTTLEILTIFLAFTAYNYYIAIAYSAYYDIKTSHYSLASIFILAVLAFFVPTTFLVTLFNISSATIVLFAMHIMYMSYCSIRDKRPYAVATALTNMAFLLPFLQDMLYIQGFINTNYYSIYGFMFFASGYLIMLNHQHTKKYVEAETYTAVLQEINSGLEEKVEERTRELREKNHQLELLTVRDGLTSIANRRYFDQQLAVSLRNVKLHDGQCSLILFDIDFFKKYNDHYGHLGGDEVLKDVARIATVCVGDDGTVARYGGEEFAVIVPTSLHDATILAQFICDSIRQEQIPHIKSEAYGVITVSVGVAEASAAYDAKRLISDADAALYEAKGSGRNRVCSITDVTTHMEDGFI